MVNNDRIVPIQRIDLLTLYGTIMNIVNQGNDPFAVLPAADVEGNFVVPADGGFFIAAQPVKTLDFGEASGATVLFVADYGFEGFKQGGEPVEPADGSAEVIPDSVSLYFAGVIEGSTPSVTCLTPQAE